MHAAKLLSTICVRVQCNWLPGFGNKLFAIKAFKKTAVIGDDDVRGLMIQKRVLALAKGSRFCCELFATLQTDVYLFFVMEFVSGGDLM